MLARRFHLQTPDAESKAPLPPDQPYVQQRETGSAAHGCRLLSACSSEVIKIRNTGGDDGTGNKARHVASGTEYQHSELGVSSQLSTSVSEPQL